MTHSNYFFSSTPAYPPNALAAAVRQLERQIWPDLLLCQLSDKRWEKKEILENEKHNDKYFQIVLKTNRAESIMTLISKIEGVKCSVKRHLSDLEWLGLMNYWGTTWRWLHHLASLQKKMEVVLTCVSLECITKDFNFASCAHSLFSPHSTSFTIFYLRDVQQHWIHLLSIHAKKLWTKTNTIFF